MRVDADQTTLTLREFPHFPKRKMKIVSFLLAVAPLAYAWAGQSIPTADGTGWRYNMTQEVSKGLRVPDIKPDADGKIRLPVLYRIGGTENVDGQELLKFEMHRAGVVTNTDLLTVDERGIICWARINVDGEFVKLNPPQTIVAMPLKRGASWNFNGQARDLKVHQHYEIAGEEDVEVPAGEFHAFRIHGEQTSPSLMTIDRWFATGTGIVKDVTTMRAANGDLLERISLEFGGTPGDYEETRGENRCDAQGTFREFCKGPVRQAFHHIFIGCASDLCALAGTSSAKRGKSARGLDRGEYRRRRSAELQGR